MSIDRRTTPPRVMAITATLLSPAAWAHSGHGLGDGAHWHATDAWGWAIGLAVAALAGWLARRK